jgi:hypothetical protein
MGSGGTPRRGDGLRAAENRTFRFAMALARTTLFETAPFDRSGTSLRDPGRTEQPMGTRVTAGQTIYHRRRTTLAGGPRSRRGG